MSRRVRVLFNPIAGAAKRASAGDKALAVRRARKLQAVCRRLTENGLEVHADATGIGPTRSRARA